MDFDILPNVCTGIGEVRRVGRLQLWYLGYGRNAWRATWIRRYYKSSIAFGSNELFGVAESRRKQGNKFCIEAVPAIRLDAFGRYFLICCINDIKPSDAQGLMRALEQGGWPEFLQYSARVGDNTILASEVGISPWNLDPEISASYVSSPNGAGWKLDWERVPNAPSNFSNFKLVRGYICRNWRSIDFSDESCL